MPYKLVADLDRVQLIALLNYHASNLFEVTPISIKRWREINNL